MSMELNLSWNGIKLTYRYYLSKFLKIHDWIQLNFFVNYKILMISFIISRIVKPLKKLKPLKLKYLKDIRLKGSNPLSEKNQY
jgi:hypothetical protein